MSDCNPTAAPAAICQFVLKLLMLLRRQARARCASNLSTVLQALDVGFSVAMEL